MCELLIADISVLSEDYSILEHRTVEVQSGRIAKIRPFSEADRRAASKKFLDGREKLLMPGLVDCHMHTGQQLLKGQILDALPMIWTRIMLPFESGLTAEKMELSAELAALEMIKSGTTAFADAGSYHMEAAARVYQKSGLRGLLSASTMDQPGLPESIAQNAGQAIAQTDRLYEEFHQKGLLRVAYSLRSLISCSEELILAAGARARERGTLLQAHMNEYPNEVNFFLQNHRMRPVEYLDRLGVLGPHFLSAHSLLLSEAEKAILAGRDVKVCHCPFSNCGKGIPDTPELRQRGLTVGLGTDGAAHGGLSLWNEMKIFRSVMNVGHGLPTADPAIMPAKTILSMATAEGYRVIGEPEAGRIVEGCKADLITVRLDQPHLRPTGNLVNTLVESVTAADVCDLAVEGNLLMKDRRVLTLDEERILYEAEKYQERLVL